MEEQDANLLSSEEDPAERAAGAAGLIGILGSLFITWGLYLVVCLGLLCGQMVWIGHHLLPFVRQMVLACGVAVIPLCLILALFRRTRLLSGLGFMIVSAVFTFATCAYCALLVYAVWSWEGLVIGTTLVGYGIMPVAALAAALHHHWEALGQIGSGAIMMFSCLYFALVLMSLALMTPNAPRSKRMPSDIDIMSS